MYGNASLSYFDVVEDTEKISGRHQLGISDPGQRDARQNHLRKQSKGYQPNWKNIDESLYVCTLVVMNDEKGWIRETETKIEKCLKAHKDWQILNE